MFKHILIPTDGSALSEKAIQGGVALAQSLGAKITGYASLAKYPYTPITEFMVETPTDFRAHGEALANTHLAIIESAAKAAGVPYASYLSEADLPYEGIIAAAKQQACDLILMASHGHSGLSALILGSETQKVLTHSTIPVLIYR